MPKKKQIGETRDDRRIVENLNFLGLIQKSAESDFLPKTAVLRKQMRGWRRPNKPNLLRNKSDT